MTSENMYHHLNMLENLVSRTNKAGARLWIDAIFFRVSAMLSGSHGQKRSLRISGTVDYTALATDPPKHESFIRNSLFQFVKRQNRLENGLFVTEAKQKGVPLVQHVAQAVAEMFASAKYLTKGILRGALTNGHKWIFLILYLNEDRDGGMYAESPTIKIQVSDSYPYRVLSPGPDIVAGILAYWMEHSFVGLDEKDWFSPLK